MPSNEAYTEDVAAHHGPAAEPRAVEIFSSLIKHLHNFAREVDLTTEEWLTACNSLVEAGQISSKDRNEMILISDVLGIEALTDSLAQERLLKATQTGDQKLKDITLSSILGPFYREGAPLYKNGESMVLTQDPENDIQSYVQGRVLDTDGNPVPNATVEIWHTGSHGFYDSQILAMHPTTALEYNWRGQFKTDADGKYACRCLRPTPYPIPFDYTAGHILKLLDRSPMRPAHIHFYVRHEGFHPLVTQIYDSKCKYIHADSTFAVKDSLIVDFKEVEGSNGKETTLDFDIVLATK